MMRAGSFRIEEDPSYGVLARCLDAETADAFEDFLYEQKYVLFHVKFEEPDVIFYFGQASSRDRVESLIERFSTEP